MSLFLIYRIKSMIPIHQWNSLCNDRASLRLRVPVGFSRSRGRGVACAIPGQVMASRGLRAAGPGRGRPGRVELDKVRCPRDPGLDGGFSRWCELRPVGL